MLFLISRFMAWKMAASFVLTAETWLGAEKTRYGDGALLAIGVSHHERLAVLQRNQPGEALGFGKQQWLQPYQVDAAFFSMLPRRGELTSEEVAELARIFGKNGDLRAQRLS